MTFIHLILCFTLGVGMAEMAVGTQDDAKTPDSQAKRPKLQLTTTISNERYLERKFRTLRWTLKLTYTNLGTEPILLDRKSSVIYRVMVSENLKAALAKRHKYDQSYSFFDPASAFMRGRSDPEERAFGTLKAGESYSIMKESEVSLYNGKRVTKDYLHPGNGFLQIRVATWYYFADPESYRALWRDRGYLWSQNITSEPMMFTVQENPTFQSTN